MGFSTQAFVSYSVFLLSVLSHLAASSQEQRHQRSLQVDESCNISPRSAPSDHEALYKVGVLANRGVETAWKEYNDTASYLSHLVGAQFDPPLSFEIVPVTFGINSPIDQFEASDIDFVFANPSIYSCVDSEVGASPLATLVQKRSVGGQVYSLTQFGGLIITQAGNSEVNAIGDIKGKTVGVISIAGLGSGQMQFRELQKAGVHHLQDPKQLIFLGSQGKIVDAVLQGEIDVGFIRTDQLERSIDSRTNELVDTSLVKIIGAKEGLVSDGIDFPFKASTPLYPEWVFSSRRHVRADIAKAVQVALFEMKDHAAIAPALTQCFEEQSCEDIDLDTAFMTPIACGSTCFAEVDKTAFSRCDTTGNAAILANMAMTSAKNDGWRSPLPYMDLRNMQQENGFIGFEPGMNSYRCMRTAEIADAVVCPEGHFKKSNEAISSGCEDNGLSCYDFPCICEPCVKAFDVDFYPASEKVSTETRSLTTGQGCSKFEFCGSVQQMHEITYRAIDNKKRQNVTFSVGVLLSDSSESFVMKQVDNFEYEFTLLAYEETVGVAIIEVFVDEEAIPESPFRFEVESRDCVSDTSDPLREPDGLGYCVCSRNSVDIGSKCVPLTTLVPSIVVPVCLLAFVCMLTYFMHKKLQSDLIWKVNPDELIIEDPPQILGQGTFGKVLLGEYRGTKVAVKRALPPRSVVGASNLATKCDTTDTKQLMIGPPIAEDHSSEDGATGSEKTACDEEKGTASLSLRHKGNFKSSFDGNLQFTNHIADIRQGLASMSLVSGSKSRSYSKNRRLLPRRAMMGVSTEYVQLEKEFIAEMRHLSKLRHPCITTVMGAVVEKGHEPMLLMEHMELGSLYDLLHNESMMIEGDTIYPILRDIAQGLRFLHTAKPSVIHGDLKSRNVLINSQFRAKVADFGLSSHRKYSGIATGTPLWMAPELLRGESPNSPETDVYSFGIVLYEVFSRKIPYEGQELIEMLRQIVDRDICLRPPIPPSCPSAMGQLMIDCIKDDPSARPGAAYIDEMLKAMKTQSAERTEKLFSELFPPNVANALRDGRKVEPEVHECVSVFFSDIVGYTEIASKLPPTKVSSLLDRLYTKFDRICNLHDVFKVETVGDAYMTVTNLAKEQEDHASIMAHFALDVLHAASTTLIDEDNPSKGTIQIRVGIHSGRVASHVVGLKNPRYSIIGDTVNVASRMETNSAAGKIHCTEATANLLAVQGPEIILESRGLMEIKGKGNMKTYWICDADGESSISLSTDDSTVRSEGDRSNEDLAIISENTLGEASPNTKIGKKRKSEGGKSGTRERLLQLNVEILAKYLRRVIAFHRATSAHQLEMNSANKVVNDVQSESSISSRSSSSTTSLNGNKNKTVIDEVTEVIHLPEYSAPIARRVEEESNKVELSPQVMSELKHFVTTIQSMYNKNPFHSFEHASHVTFSLHKLLAGVVAPKELNDIDIRRREFTVHEYTYGISSDPLTQFAVIFCALIHDVDHPGVPNTQLVNEHSKMANMYHNQSVAEQNSIDMSWNVWMSPEYYHLRSAVTNNTNQQHQRFRQLVINTVLATDIVDKELKELRNKRWEAAFSDRAMMEVSPHENVNRKATVVLEHLIQASDVAHTMQHWHVYRKWNERFFNECCAAYEEGRAEKDPCENWYKGELGFFDFYIIPLTQKLKDCGVFGVSSNEYLNLALRNRQEWEIRGQEVVADMKAKRIARKAQKEQQQQRKQRPNKQFIV